MQSINKKAGQEDGKFLQNVSKLKQSLEYVQDIVDTVREPFLVLDTNLRVVTANTSFYKSFMVYKKQTEGKLVYELGNNQWDIPKLRSLLENILSRRSSFKDFEVSHIFPSIGHKIMLLNARRIDAKELILLSIEDITKRKKIEESLARSEKRFRALIEKSEDAFALVTPLGKVIYASPSTKAVLGYTDKELQRLKNPFALVPPDDRRFVTKVYEELMRKPDNTARVVYRVKHKSGTYKWIESVMTNLLENPDVNAIVLNYRDVTKRKELENQKDNFIGIASHELKTPVTSIKAYTQILKKRFMKQGDVAATQNLAKMDAQVNKLNSLISDLLDVTKMETGKLVFNQERFDFDSLVKEIVEDIQLTSEKHTISIKGKTNRKVFADRERIGLVLVNFLTNAIKYSPKADEINVYLSTDKNTITVAVQDFGIGIENVKQAKVFERFFRVSTPKSETYPGLGLGLYIASEIIKRHGGKVRLKSKVGKGSTFYFTIPVGVNK